MTPSPTAPRLDPAHLGLYLQGMTRVARALCHGDANADADAEDLVQDALERVLRRPRTVHGDPAPYLAQAVRYAYLDRRRARQARVEHVAEAEGQMSIDHRAEATPQLRVELQEVLAAVKDLPEPNRDAVVALDLLGYSAREVSARTGVTVGTLESRAFRGRARVATRMAA